MLKRILNQTFEQYVFDRVDNILSTAGETDAEYAKAVKAAETVLSQLMTIAIELEAQQPELLRLVMEFEAAATFESGLAAEIAYREGMRDCRGLRREFLAFIRE